VLYAEGINDQLCNNGILLSVYDIANSNKMVKVWPICHCAL